MERRIERGDLTQVTRMTKARGLKNGKGYSYSLVKKVLSDGIRTNDEIVALHDEVVALRTPPARQKRRAA